MFVKCLVVSMFYSISTQHVKLSTFLHPFILPYTLRSTLSSYPHKRRALFIHRRHHPKCQCYIREYAYKVFRLLFMQSAFKRLTSFVLPLKFQAISFAFCHLVHPPQEIDIPRLYLNQLVTICMCCDDSYIVATQIYTFIYTFCS